MTGGLQVERSGRPAAATGCVQPPALGQCAPQPYSPVPPPGSRSLHPPSVFIFFACWNLLMTVWVFFLLPGEPQGRGGSSLRRRAGRSAETARRMARRASARLGCLSSPTRPAIKPPSSCH